MANDFYNTSGTPAQGSAGSSATMRAEFTAIALAFDKFPALAASAGRLLAVNAGGTAIVSTNALAISGSDVTAGANFTVTGSLAVNGNTALGNAAGDTLTVAPSAVTWSNNPTHSGSHTFIAITVGALQTTGNTALGNDSADTLTVAGSAVTWSNNPTHSGNHVFSGNVTVTGNLAVNGNTTIGNASGDTLTIAPNTVNWTAATTTHANSHTFSGNISAPRLLLAAGSAANPGLWFGDVGTGIYSSATDTIAFTAAGSGPTWLINSGGQLTNSAAAPTFGTTGKLHIAGTTSTFASSLVISRTSADSAGAVLRFGKSRSASIGGYAAVQSSDDLGAVNWYGANGTDGDGLAARIRVTATETHTPTARGGQIEFATTATGSTTFNTRMVIEDSAVTVATDLRTNGSGALKIGSLISRFESSEQSVPSVTGTTNFAHGGTRAPDLFTLVLRCKTAELGYAVGDEVILNAADVSDNTRQSTLRANATNVIWSYITSGSGTPAIRAAGGTGAITAVTAGSWRLVVKAHWL